MTKRKVANGAAKASSAAHKDHAAVRSDDDPDSIDSVLLETAQDMLEAGLMDKADYEQIFVRHVKKSFAIGGIAAITNGKTS